TGGPHFPAGNIPRATQLQVDFVTELLSHTHHHDIVRVEAEEEAAHAWTDHVAEAAATRLVADSSWFIGGNIPGKKKETLIYMGGLPSMRESLQQAAAAGFEGLTLTDRAEIPS
ncbi:hypothetical protein, partial [Paenarthrobacter aurescens]|uniref:hypothetical protein n=1 Tax=Paenarthrobacter aurescens TaxID=43663 RepID=UPI0035EF8217